MEINIPRPEDARKYFEEKVAFTTGPVEVDHLRRENAEMVRIIDVRAAEDYRKGHVPGAVNVPEENWSNPQGLSQNKLNIVYCYSVVCHLAARACVRFAKFGYPVMEMDGGFESWQEHDLKVEETPTQEPSAVQEEPAFH